jgi:hypothetical protein
VAQGLSDAARKLQTAGADLILIATNTMHIVFDQVQASVDVPMLSLLDAVGDTINSQGLATVGLLGTRFTMEKTFYQDSLSCRGIDVLVPDAKDREYVNRVSSATNPGPGTLTSLKSWQTEALRASSSAAPRYHCCSGRKMLAFPCSTQPPSTPKRRFSLRSENNQHAAVVITKPKLPSALARPQSGRNAVTAVRARQGLFQPAGKRGLWFAPSEGRFTPKRRVSHGTRQKGLDSQERSTLA